MDDGASRAFFVDHGFDRAQSILGLLTQRVSTAGNGGGEHVTDIIQTHNGVTDSLARYFPDQVIGHG